MSDLFTTLCMKGLNLWVTLKNVATGFFIPMNTHLKLPFIHLKLPLYFTKGLTLTPGLQLFDQYGFVEEEIFVMFEFTSDMGMHENSRKRFSKHVLVVMKQN